MSKVSVAFFGTKGSFTYLAAQKYFEQAGEYVSNARFRDVFTSIKENRTTFGVIPIENTLAGSIYENYDLLTEYGLSIVGEVSLHIEHALLVNHSYKDKPIDSLTDVYSHPKALEQCEQFILSHPQITPHPYDDTATAAKFIAENAQDKPWAAIAHPGNAKLWGLHIAASHLEDNAKNFTRFFIIAKDIAPSYKNVRKCSLSFRLPHRVGSLGEVLTYFTQQQLNLTKLESRPLVDKPFEYTFYVDLLLPPDKSDEDILKGLRQYTQSYQLLGIYTPAL